MSLEPKAQAVDPARVTAGEWAALFYRQRVIDEQSPAARNLEQREIDRLAEELVKRAHDNGATPKPGPEIIPVLPVLPGTPAAFANEPCHVCGGRWADMTNYVCSHPNCPRRVTWQSAENSAHGFTEGATTTP